MQPKRGQEGKESGIACPKQQDIELPTYEEWKALSKDSVVKTKSRNP